MSTDNQDIDGLKAKVSELEARVQALERLLDNEDHSLFEQWFIRFLDDKCNGGW